MNILQDKIERYFNQIRHDQSHHLGLGDIRLTTAQQDEIVEMAKGEDKVSSEYNTFSILGVTIYHSVKSKKSRGI